MKPRLTEFIRRLLEPESRANAIARVRELAVKAEEGELSTAERAEYELYVEALDVAEIGRAHV